MFIVKHEYAWLLMGLLVLSGCGESSPPNRAAAESEADDELKGFSPEDREKFKEVSLVQSQGLKGATCQVQMAYNYPGKTEAEPVDGAKLIGVRVEFRDWKKGFDLDDVDVIDAADNQNYGSDPLIQFLTEQGDFIDDNDPDFDAEGPLRCLLIYAVPKSCQAIKLGYWGDVIAPTAIPLADTGPVRPESSERVLKIARRDRAGAKFDRYLLEIEATGWPRSSQPDWLNLSSDQGEKILRGDVEAWIETDPELKVVSSQIVGKPYYLRTRYFLVEMWFPQGKPPEYFGVLRSQRIRLPELKEFTIPPPTLAALDAAPRNPFATHRNDKNASGNP